MENGEQKPQQSQTPKSYSRVIRADLIIATLALLASAGASIATVVQTRTIGNQLSASVWPYLSFNYSLSDRELSASFKNEGLGPALVRTFTVSMDGRRQARLRGLIGQLVPKKHGDVVTVADFGGGSVIRPGDVFTLFSVVDSRIDVLRTQASERRINAVVCYCSLLGNCWTLDANATEPQAARSCGQATPKLVY